MDISIWIQFFMTCLYCPHSDLALDLKKQKGLRIFNVDISSWHFIKSSLLFNTMASSCPCDFGTKVTGPGRNKFQALGLLWLVRVGASRRTTWQYQAIWDIPWFLLWWFLGRFCENTPDLYGKKQNYFLLQNEHK